MSRLVAVPAEEKHIRPVASAMRAADRAEVWAAAQRTPEQALRFSLALSDDVFTGLVDGKPAFLFGVGETSHLLGTGAPWMLGTPATTRYARDFLAGSVEILSSYRARYRRLTNFVDIRNTASLRWLRWLGFEIRPPAPHGPFGLPFSQFSIGGTRV